MEYKFSQKVTKEDYISFVTNHMKNSFLTGCTRFTEKTAPIDPISFSRLCSKTDLQLKFFTSHLFFREPTNF